MNDPHRESAVAALPATQDGACGQAELLRRISQGDEELVAGAIGQPVEGAAREHLAACPYCQREAERWGLVADGVRGVMSAGALETKVPARPRRTRQDVVPPRRPIMGLVAAAAAALVLLVGLGVLTGTVHVRLSSRSSSTVLTAVSGCSQLEQAQGPLVKRVGNLLVIRTANARELTLTTTERTFVSASGALLDDITDGASVMVRGYRSVGTMRAAIVTVGQPFSAVGPTGFVALQGTVSDRSPIGFDLETSTGDHVKVTTSPHTLVIAPRAKLSQLQTGTPIFALVTMGPDGTTWARAIAAVSQFSSGKHISISVKNCSPNAIVEAAGRVSVLAASVGP